MLNKAFTLGLGFLNLSREKAEEFFDELVERGEITREEARESIDDLLERGEAQREELRGMFKEESEKFKAECGRVSVREFEELKEKVAALEQKLAQLETPAE